MKIQLQPHGSRLSDLRGYWSFDRRKSRRYRAEIEWWKGSIATLVVLAFLFVTHRHYTNQQTASETAPTVLSKPKASSAPDAISDHWVDLYPLSPGTSLKSSIPESHWGMLTISKGTSTYPSSWSYLTHLFWRIRSQYSGIELPTALRLPMNSVIGLYCIERVQQPNAFTVFYSPGLDGSSTLIAPIMRTNAPGNVRSVRASLETLLAANGFAVAHIQKNVIKVFSC
jgi:hypothetical protein